MKYTTIALIFGTVVLLLGLVGIFSGEGKMFGEMNIDMRLDVVRLALGAFLIYAGLKSAELAKTAVTIFGVLYLGMFVLGLISPDLFGMVPNELGMMDQGLHLFGGIAGVLLPMMYNKNKRNNLAV